MEKESNVPYWVTYLEWDVLGKSNPSGAVVYEIVVKVRAENILGVLKARGDGEGYVSFVGARKLSSLSGAVRKRVEGEGEKWRLDKYYNP